MDSVGLRFNLYLLAAVSVLLCAGCATHKKKELVTSLRVHVEAKENTTFARKIKVFESHPIEMTIDQSPLLTDAEVDKASVVDALGGFALVIQFDKRGQWLLDQHTSLNLGRHLAIFVQYGEKSEKACWLAAPILSNRISDGALIFTPDVSREDAELIAKGLGIKKGLDKPAKNDK